MDTEEIKKKLEAVADAGGGPDAGGGDGEGDLVEVSVQQTVPEQARQVLAAVAESPDPGLVLHGGLPSRMVLRGERLLLEAHTRESLRGHLARVVRFVRRDREGAKCACDPGIPLIEDLLSLPDYGDAVPCVTGIRAAPLLTPDGELIAASGLYPEHRVYLDLDPALEGMEVPGAASEEQLAAATETILDPFDDFPLEEDSVSNLFALLCTMVLRELIEGVTPLFIVDANTRGSGKGLLVSVASIIAYGREADFSPANVGSDELRKRLLAVFRQGQPLHVLDNIEQVVWSPELSAALTSGSYSDRVLGVSELPVYRNNLILVGTGNNIRLGGDIPRRTVLIRLRSPHARPEERTGFRYPNLLAHVRRKRREILHAIYTVAAAWLRAGRPVPESAPTMGSFQPWADFSSGLLDTVGGTGLLENRAQLRARDLDEEELDVFLTRVREAFGDGEFTARQLCETIETEDLPAALGGSQNLHISKRMGRFLTGLGDRRVGDESLFVRHVRTVSKTKHYRVERAGRGSHE